MIGDAAPPAAEIVIVRRRSDDSGHGGSHGAWKIAYADFVTAMMAFFLVMWLINASNEATRAQVASYFNPIKLTDSSTGRRGLKEKKDDKTSPAGDAQDASGTSQTAAEPHGEEQLIANPEKALERIVAGHIAETGAPAVAQPGAVDEPSPSNPVEPAPGARDPFDPRTWENVQEAPAPIAAKDTSKPAARDETPHQAGTAAEPPIAEKPIEAAKPEPAPKNEIAANNSSTPETSPASATAPGMETSDRQSQEAAVIAADIATRMGTGLDDLPASVEVKITAKGILISLTDKHSFGMFKTGSAEPEMRMVELVGAIAGALANREGFIVVRGHTDSRPYRNKKYDNWQLSTARAHFAQYMLVKGALDEKRIRRVEGVADRQPRIPDDPQAAENRRIEILLGRDSP